MMYSGARDRERETLVKKLVAERWSRESPALVKVAVGKELGGYPLKCSPETHTMIESSGMKRSEEILRDPSLWPQWFRTQVTDYINNGVTKGLDTEFQTRVKNQASAELQRLVNINCALACLEIRILGSSEHVN